MYDIAIIGGGPAGFEAAIRAKELGANVLLVEKKHLGGTCLNVGCIPSKSVISSVEKYNSAKKFEKFGVSIENIGFDFAKVYERKDLVVEKLRKNLGMSLKNQKIDVISGEASIKSRTKLEVVSQDGEVKTYEFKNLILATGSRPAVLPNLEPDGEFILNSDDILGLQSLPKSVLIVGSGAIGVEWARIFHSFGTEVHLLELAPHLAPTCDISVSERLERIFKIKKLNFYTNTKIQAISGKTVTLENGKVIEPEIIFSAAGRSPNTEIKGLEVFSPEMDGKFFKIDENMKTSTENLYAIGDITGKLQLAHVASSQGITAVDYILKNKQGKMNYKAVPQIIYGEPEIASVGETQQKLEKDGIAFNVNIFPVSATGKYYLEDELEGFVKVLASPQDGKILGVHIIAHCGAELIQQATIAYANGLSVEDVKQTVFAHPAYSEALHQSFMGLNI